MMRITSNQEIDRNFDLFERAVCDGESYGDLYEQFNMSRQRVGGIVNAVARRIVDDGFATPAMVKAFREGGIPEIRKNGFKWLKAAKESREKSHETRSKASGV